MWKLPPLYKSVVQSQRVTIDTNKYTFEHNMPIANVKVHGDWKSCELRIGSFFVDAIYKEVGEWFDMFSNGKFVQTGRYNLMTLYFEKPHPHSAITVEYDIVSMDPKDVNPETDEVKDGDYPVWQTQLHSIDCKSRGPQRDDDVIFVGLAQRLLVYSDHSISNVQLVIDGSMQHAFTKIGENCWMLYFKNGVKHPFKHDFSLQFTNTSFAQNNVRLYARCLNSLVKWDGVAGMRWRR